MSIRGRRWEVTWFEMLQVLAQRSTCPRLHTAGVVVDANHRPLAFGYNGAAKGQPHCEDVGCTLVDGHCLLSSHAEENIITQAATTNISIAGCDLFILHLPCYRCARLIVGSRLQRVVYLDELPKYDNQTIKSYFQANNIEVTQFQL